VAAIPIAPTASSCAIYSDLPLSRSICSVEIYVSSLNIARCGIFLDGKSKSPIDEDFGRGTQSTKYTLQPGADGRVEILSSGVSGPGSLSPIVSETGRNWVTVITGHSTFECVRFSVSLELRSCLNVHSYEDMHVMDGQMVGNKRDGMSDGELGVGASSFPVRRPVPKIT